MESGVKTLLEGIIDYAGLFPPASLSMESAFAAFMGHRRGADGWMISHFVCPAARLDELEPLLEATDEADLPVSLAVLGSGGDTVASFLEAVDRDADALRGLASRNGERAVADVFEVRLPVAGGAAVAVADGSQRLHKGSGLSITPFFEVSLLGDWRPRLPAAAAAVRDANRDGRGTNPIGLKIRCGGLEAAAVPEIQAVAAAIAIGAATGVPLKATQGLHHAVRQYEPTLDTTVHGFINLFVAATLARVHDLPVVRVAEIVAEEDPDAFALGGQVVGWRGMEASSDQVVEARRLGLTTFGSCNFEEPRDELRNLGLVQGDVPP
jgi:hypothetical protein